MSRLRVVADANIPLVREAFAPWCELSLIPGRDMDRDVLRRADALVVRSVTHVDEALLRDTPVQFVGTCTIGTDHLDIPWLESVGIRWASSPGCNARSVGEFICTSLLRLHRARRLDLSRHPVLGIVGCGHTGSAVEKISRSLGLDVLCCDPPRARQEGGSFLALSELLPRCDIVTFHVPLTRDGEDATHHLLGSEKLALLKPGAVLINASRGAVIDRDALTGALDARSDLTAVIDVWDPEPAFPPALARRAWQITPHIAGHSREGKLEGTRRIREALGRQWQLPTWEIPPETVTPLPPLDFRDLSPWDALADLATTIYDPSRDDAFLRPLLDQDDDSRAREFDLFRRHYPVRHEWAQHDCTAVKLPPEAQKLAAAAGFPVP